MNKFLSKVFCWIVEVASIVSIILVLLLSAVIGLGMLPLEFATPPIAGVGIAIVGIVFIAICFGAMSVYIEIYKVLEEIRDILRANSKQNGRNNRTEPNFSISKDFID